MAKRKTKRRATPAQPRAGVLRRAWNAIPSAGPAGAVVAIIKWALFALVVLFLGYLVVSNTWMASRLCEAKVAEEVERRSAIVSEELKKAEQRKSQLRVQLERARQSINQIRESADAGQCINQRVPDSVIDAANSVQ